MKYLDYKSIKEDFPLLKTKMNGHELVFLDSAASSQMPQKVIDSFNDYYRCRHANIHRGAYRLSYEATDLYEQTRIRVAKFLNVADPETCIFTRNTTEGINLIAQTWGRQNLKEKDEIIISRLEHHSNLIPWYILAKEKNLVLKHLPITLNGEYEYDKLSSLINSNTKIVALQHQSNALGTIHNIDKISEIIKQAKTKFNSNLIFVLDGAQAAPHIPVDLKKLDCDFYCFSAHKMLGPTGVGVLYGKKNILENMPPFLGGGDMILSVRDFDYDYAEIPRKFEAGTPNIAGVVVFSIALDYLEKIGLDNIHKHELNLKKYALELLTNEIKDITIYGQKFEDKNSNDLSAFNSGGIISFNLKNIHSHDLATILDNEGIAIRAGHHCCEPLMRFLNISSTARISFYLYNGPSDIEKLILGLKKVKSIFK